MTFEKFSECRSFLSKNFLLFQVCLKINRCSPLVQSRIEKKGCNYDRYEFFSMYNNRIFSNLTSSLDEISFSLDLLGLNFGWRRHKKEFYFWLRSTFRFPSFWNLGHQHRNWGWIGSQASLHFWTLFPIAALSFSPFLSPFNPLLRTRSALEEENCFLFRLFSSL